MHLDLLVKLNYMTVAWVIRRNILVSNSFVHVTFHHTALDQSIIVSTDFEDLMDQLAALNNPIFHAFCLFLNGVICEESLAEIFVSTEPQECLWNEVKYLICRDDQKHSLFLEMFKNDPHTAKIASQLQGTHLING